MNPAAFTPRLGGRAEAFPDLAWDIYLNHAGVSPVSAPVRDAIRGVADDYAAHGFGAFPRWMAQREVLRQKLGRLLQTAPERVALTHGTTTSLNDLALSLPWAAGDRVVVFDGEFPANVTPWQQAADTFGVAVTRLPLAGFHDGSGDGLARLEATLRAGGVRAVAVSAVQFQSGLRMPLREMADLAHAAGAFLIVDAIQALGSAPLYPEALGVDALVAGAHKWLMGVEGCGLAWIGPALLQALVPRTAGWLSHEDPVSFLFQGAGHLRYDRPIRQRADYLEGGAYNTLGFAALEASVDLLLALGLERIDAHIQSLLDPMEAALLERGFTSLRAAAPASRSALLCVHPPQGVELTAFYAAMTARRVAIATPDGALRFAPHWPNPPQELPALLAALDESLDEAAQVS